MERSCQQGSIIGRWERNRLKVIICAGSITDKIAKVYIDKSDTIEIVGKYKSYNDCIQAILSEATDFDTLLFLDLAFRDTEEDVSLKVKELADSFDIFLTRQELKILFKNYDYYNSFGEFLNSQDRITAIYSDDLKFKTISDLLIKNYKTKTVDENLEFIDSSEIQNQYDDDEQEAINNIVTTQDEDDERSLANVVSKINSDGDSSNYLDTVNSDEEGESTKVEQSSSVDLGDVEIVESINTEDGSNDSNEVTEEVIIEAEEAFNEVEEVSNKIDEVSNEEILEQVIEESEQAEQIESEQAEQLNENKHVIVDVKRGNRELVTERARQEEIEEPEEKVEKDKLKGLLSKKKSKEPSFVLNSSNVSSIFTKVPPVPKGNYLFRKGVVVVTGDRGMGLTVTAVNLAQVISSMGVKVVIVDFDINKRDTNNYFVEFGRRAEANEFLSKSLIGCLIDVANIDRYVFSINNNLSIIGLPYSFNFGTRDKKRIFTESNMINLLSILRSFFDIIIIDLPFNIYLKNDFLGNFIDLNIFCLENNFSSVVGCMHLMLDEANETGIDFRRIIFKTKFLLNKYNYLSKVGNRAFSISTTRNIIVKNFEYLDNYALNFVGIVPMSFEYIEQMNKHRPIVTFSKEYSEYYDSLFSNF